ncbi:hypothetical protein SAMN05421848_0619 [Kushneria avicenniae]|uniref:Uncharacterized protein n=1 Tax=Kushneria avicenniae TaxID=402385 RepID=A0A1I1GK03_9GAMM|nr:hypothetical protein [Kushneria avicenniae]SFC11884.1 hypothetical protein SAMN05421848_0619 [Kushneria avicenniae]
MVKFIAASHSTIRALLPCLLLGVTLAQAAPPTSERVGLPDDARPVWIGDQRYYLARDTWFVASGSDGRYTPTPAPREVQMAGINMFDVIAYPIDGQDLRQQQQDRGRCHRWAIDQSGFDPAATLTPPSRLQADTWRRALAACLAGHRYSVQ